LAAPSAGGSLEDSGTSTGAHGEPRPPSPHPLPFLSVIVTAHGRRQYLLGAVRSIVRQQVPREEYEVLVVKDFADPSIDAELDRSGVSHRETSAVPLGAKVALGTREARGEVLLFLEDDDEYSPGRLSHILELFRADPSLGFYRNGQDRIDADGQPLPLPSYGRAHDNLIRLGSVRSTAEELPKRTGTLARVDPDFNLSSMAIRRRILLPLLTELAGQSAAVDSFMFYAALGARQTVLVESAPLTRYRIHGSNISLWTASDAEGRQKRAAYQRSFLEGFRPIYERAVRDGPPTAARLAGGNYFGSWVLYRVLTCEGGRGALLGDLLRYWRWSPRGVARYRKDITAWGLGAIVAPRRTQSRFIAQRAREASRARPAG